MTRAVESLRLVFFICASTPLSDISNGCYFHHYKSLRGGEDADTDKMRCDMQYPRGGSVMNEQWIVLLLRSKKP